MIIGGSTPIKRIQRGSSTVYPAGTTTVSINSVDVGKAMVVVSTLNGWKNGNVSGNYSGTASISAGAVLTNGTTLTLTAGTSYSYQSTGSAGCQTKWEVVEYV
jgi:aspartyl aminopeptidase|tara:strand:- start:391 stop:699 length:309 start_codon:yes stop_codon:yes gene_type:complete